MFIFRATVLYDRPPDIFRPITLTEKHNFLNRFAAEYPIFNGSDTNDTVFTYAGTDSEARLKETRPALVISSTSWTDDEDFSILLQALEST